MPRKKSIKRSAQGFTWAVNEIENFATAGSKSLSNYVPWVYDYAIIRLYREFEWLILDVLIGAINNDPSTVSSTVGVKFPRHLNRSVCEFLVIGTGYFDFKGRDGLIKTLKEFLPENHSIVTIVKKDAYRDALEKLSALRNFAAHESAKSKSAALKATSRERIKSSGEWLRKHGRFLEIIKSLKALAAELDAAAPY